MGVLVSLSGLDGSGKTTQGKILTERCCREGISAFYIHLKNIDTKESYFKVRAKAKDYIKQSGIDIKKEKDELRKVISAFLFVDKVKNEVEPALLSHEVVVVDRYIDSALNYHMLESGDCSSVEKIYEDIPAPDVNVFLNLKQDECIKRVHARQETTKYENEESFMKAYGFYSSRRERFIWIDANRERETIADEIFCEVKKQLGEVKQDDRS